MKILWIKNGRVIDPANDRDEKGDVFAVDGKIVKRLSKEQKERAKSFDADGMIVCPGLVDLNTHLREPGGGHKETIATGTRAAAAGGFTSIICMSNFHPPADNIGTIQLIKDSAERNAVVNVYPTGCVTMERKGEHLAPIGSLKEAGVIAVSDAGHCIQNAEIMRRAVEYAGMFNLPILDHCENANLTKDCVMNEGEWSLRLGLRGMPKAAEDIMVARDVIFAEQTQTHIHLQHISSATAIEIIRSAKMRGVPITAEVSPHHLALTVEDLADYNTNLKVSPPLRTEKDRSAILQGLENGTLDCIASSHAPHTKNEKDREFDYAPFGCIALETTLPVALRALVFSGILEMSSLVELLTIKPARIIGINKGTLSEDADADITIFDPRENWEVIPQNLHSKAHNSPWLGKMLQGQVKATFVGGKRVH